MKQDALIFFAAALILGAVVVVGLRAEDTSNAARALRAMGYTDELVQSGSMWSFGCGKGEIAYEAKATNPAGTRVNLLVCCNFSLAR